jgi:hypothetical protein
VSARRPLLLSLTVVAVAVIVLVILGLHAERTQVLSLRVPDSETVATLTPRSAACEGPVGAATGSIQAATIWGASVSRRTTLEVYARSGAGGIVARGRAPAGTVAATQTVDLVPQTHRNHQVTICVRDAGTAPFMLLGSATNPGVRTTIGGKRTSAQFSLALLGPRRSTFSGLPLAFSRAALFRPGWVGSWTFWVLLAGLLVAAGLIATAVMAASHEDE